MPEASRFSKGLLDEERQVLVWMSWPLAQTSDVSPDN